VAWFHQLNHRYANMVETSKGLRIEFFAKEVSVDRRLNRKET